MKAIDLLRPKTSHHVQQRGWEYVNSVDTITGDARSVNARVQGTYQYEVTIRAEAGRLLVWCSCPYFVDRGNVCKHLWAVAMAANERGWVADLPPNLRVVIDLDDEVDHEVESGERYRFGGPFLNPVPSRRRAAPPEWTAALSAVSAASEDNAASTWVDTRLIYVFKAPVGATLSELPLLVERVERKRDGGWSKPQQSRLTLSAIDRLPDADDRWALSLVYAASSLPRSGHAYNHFVVGSQQLGVVYVRAPLLDLLLPRLCVTERVRLRQAPANVLPLARSDDDVALRWDDGTPWQFRLVVTSGGGTDALGKTTAGPHYRVDGVLSRGDARVNIAEFALLTDSIAVLDGAASRFDPAGGFAWATQVRARGAFTVPADLKRTLIDAIVASGVEGVDLPDDIRWEEQAVAPTFRARVGRPDRSGGSCPIEIDVAYGEAGGPLVGGALLTADGRTRYRRDSAAELDAIATLKRQGVTGLDSSPGQPASTAIAARRVAALVHTLLARGWHVEADGLRYRALAAPQLRVRSGIDWFEIDALDDAGVAVDLSDLLKALEAGRRTVTLGDGTIGMLPEQWLARVAPLLMLGESGGSGVRFKASQVALIDAMLAGRPAVDWDEGFVRARNALARFDGVRPVEAPETFHGALRSYQQEALGWMQFLRDFGFGGCLADDMGLGKTVMVLAMLDARRLDPARPHRPSLVVLPRSLLFNWTSEAVRFAPGLRVLDFARADRHAAAHAVADTDLVLTTYGTLRRDVAALRQQHFDYVVLDEAQAIKNAGTASAKAVRLLHADHRLALTGTPVENHLGELHSLFEFLNPGLLGKGHILDSRKMPGDADPQEHVARLAKGLRPFFLRRTKEQVAPELPPRTDETLYCELEGEQRRVYRELRDHYRRVLLAAVERDGLAKSRFQILEALLRLRQAACHTDLLPGRRATGARRGQEGDSDRSSAKFDVLLPRLAELVAEGRKALVFSQFTSLLALLRQRLDADGVGYAYLDGQTRDRARIVSLFQDDPSCPLFLISLKAGGVGLNLTAAEYVFLLDPWWNPAVELQAIDRTHRIGQAKPVFAYRLVARDTVEERILELQSRKRALADAILDAGLGGLRGLQREDLEQLFS